jgi:ATP-dependent helicase HrpB
VFISTLPILTILPELISQLEQRNEAIIEAPPGAGKTTQIPLSLLDFNGLGGQKILMLEPRRLAAKAAASRMSEMLKEKVGHTVGYRVRHDSCVSKHTRIEVVTEGILTRMIQTDPTLGGIGIVIFDEFHERHLEADLGLALTLQARQIFRDSEPLKIIMMSATVDDDAISNLLDHTPVIRSKGKMYSVEVHYSPASDTQTNRLEETVAHKISQVLSQEEGSLLVFLPGQREIKKVYELVQSQQRENKQLLITPLFGNLSLDEQTKAIQPAPEGKRKIVLATDIAETSLTINGVRVVIDAGLSRKPVFDTASGMTRLHTKRLSRASSIQRMGRAGRTEPGSCYRLWSEVQQQQLIEHTLPEILQADLVPLALQLLLWGVNDPNELQWIDPPPVTAYQQALELLQQLGAVTFKEDSSTQSHWVLTEHGSAMAAMPLHPRLAHMILMGQKFGLHQQACEIAAILSERDPIAPAANKNRERDADIQARIEVIQSTGQHSKRHAQYLNYAALKNIRNLIKEFKRQKVGDVLQTVEEVKNPIWSGFLIALAYPERIAQQRQPGSSEYRMSSGRAAHLGQYDLLQQQAYLAVAHASSHKGGSSESIYLAAPLSEELFEDQLKSQIQIKERVYWDNKKERLIAEEHTCFGQLVIRRTELASINPEDRTKIVLDRVRQHGLALLPWTDEMRQWQARILLLCTMEQGDTTKASEWPDVSEAGLISNLDEWLGPYVAKVSLLKHLAELDLKQILTSQINWAQSKLLDELVPVKIEVPSGSQIRINYLESPPVLAVRLQEMFGCEATPTIARGKVALKLHLLSPAKRPLQVTQDLATFWNNAYQQVKKEMRGRYPKHIWPDDPVASEATRYTIKKQRK